MQKPACWNGDPECGHLVAHPYQTHYCTYIRVPKLLCLQQPAGDHPDELLAVLALQAFELWFKVLLNDLAAVLAELQGSPSAVQLTKLLNRASRLVRLLDGQADVAETILLHDLGLRLSLDVEQGEQPSDQFRRLKALTERTATALAQAKPGDPRLLRAGQDYLGRFKRWSPRFEQLLQDLIDPAGTGAPDYPQYLHLETLLALQAGVKADWTPIGQSPQGHSPTELLSPDELLFIVVHQVFELWFRAQLHELDAVLLNLASELPDAAGASRRLRRVVRLQILLVDMIHIPATMLPLDFLQFRAQTRIIDGLTYERGLSPASGTESYQFRELEIAAGLKENAAHAELLHGNRRMHIRFLTPAQAERLNQPSLPQAFRHALEARGIQDLLGIFQPARVPNPHADLAELADLLLEFDKFFQLWRMNHLTMVQSMIGRKSGTGFLGPEYLKETVGMGIQAEDDRLLPTPQIRPRFFEDLWEARTRMSAEGRGSDG
jgi:tryptophan 2,3-dioxygenase